MGEEADKKAKRGRGRPTDYKPEYAEQARKLAQLGATDIEMADFFGVALSTINRWKIVFPEFSESSKLGKEVADERVEQSLFKRATGYTHHEDDIRAINGEIVITPTLKHYPPDTAAAIFWLKNRKKEHWRDKIEHDHGVQEDNPLATVLQQLAGKTLRPSSKDDSES